MRITSPLYWSGGIYRTVMRLLYGAQFDERYAVVSRLIPDGARVVELCCGCGYLYENFLRRRRIDYLGIDLLPQMIRRLQRLGARVEAANVASAEVPPADFVLMLGSLYHFHPNEACILRKMAQSGTGIVLEPVANLSQSTNPMIRLLARTMSSIPGTNSAYRLTAERFETVLKDAGVEVVSSERVLNAKYALTIFRSASEAGAR